MRRGKTHGLHPDGARPATLYVAEYEEEDIDAMEAVRDVVIRCGVGGESGIDHPAVMAIKMAQQLVSLSCPKGGTVLDPYTGSGTTGIAALRRERSFIGHELQGAYVDLARNRIRDDSPLLNTHAEAVA